MERLKHLSYRQKNMLLLALSVVVGFVAWSIAIAPTAELASACGELEAQAAQAGMASEQKRTMEKELAQLNAVIGQSEGQETEVQQRLLETVTSYCKDRNTSLERFLEPHQFQETEYLVSTNTVTVQGDFVQLLELVHQLEQEFGAARLAAVDYHTKKNQRTRKTYLYATLYLQNIHRL